VTPVLFYLLPASGSKAQVTTAEPIQPELDEAALQKLLSS
jgi:hypothetical protein